MFMSRVARAELFEYPHDQAWAVRILSVHETLAGGSNFKAGFF